MTMKRKRHTFVVYVEDKPGVLNRVASLFRRRAFNIDSLTVGHSETTSESRMTIVVESDASGARRIEANLYKLVNVVRVHDITHTPSIFRELAMVKVAAAIETRTQIMQLVDVFRARVVDIAPDSLVIETTGTEEKIEGLLEVLRPYGILELVRTGRVGMVRGKQGIAVEASDRVEDEDPAGDGSDTEDPHVSYSV
ncbi:MAG: acetolactate synthase small subunit [Acidobacteriota bacterium]|nr:acetolactate synthase small subunit [Acidobacteriota bacterium]